MMIILKIILCSGLLLGLYYLFLAKEKTFTFNRFYLLFALVFSYTIPFIPIEREHHTDQKQPFIFENVSQQPISEITVPVQENFSYEEIFLVGYVIIASLFLMKLIYSMIRLKKLKGEKIVYKNKTVILLEKEIAPFSFMNRIYFSKTYFKDNEIDEYMFLHEKIHVEQKHSLDIFLVEILKILMWFNPFIYLYKKAVATNHEFLADEKVIHENNDIKNYQHLILSEIVKKQHLDLVHPFNFNNTKKRFIMMTTQNSKSAQVKKYLSVPVFAALALLFAEKVYANDTAEIINNGSELFETSKSDQKNHPEALQEFLKITEKYEDIIKNKDFERFKKEVPRNEQVKLVELFNKIDLKNRMNLPIWIGYHEINKQIPTQKQLNQFLDSKYNISLDGNIADNTILKNYKTTDFYSVYVLKVLPKNPDYGKYEYGVTLYTTEYAKKFNSQKNISLSFKVEQDKQYEEYLKSVKEQPVKTINENKKVSDIIRPKEGKNTNLNQETVQNSNQFSSSVKSDEQLPAEFPGGIEKLRNEFTLAFDSKNTKGLQGNLRSNISILIDEKGNLKMLNVSGENEIVNNEISRAIFAVLQNKKWKPATKDGIPVESNFKFPIILSQQ